MVSWLEPPCIVWATIDDAAYLSSEAVHNVAIGESLLAPWANTAFASAVATVRLVAWEIFDCRYYHNL